MEPTGILDISGNTGTGVGVGSGLVRLKYRTSEAGVFSTDIMVRG